MKDSRHTGDRGTTLVIALAFAAVLITLSSASFMLVQRKYRLISQAASWRRALLSADAGVELALNEMRRPLYEPDAQPFAGWQTDTTASSSRYSRRELERTGEDGTHSYCRVTVDKPTFLRRNNEQWFRVRSTGIIEISGGAIVLGDRADRDLRRFRKNAPAKVDSPLLARAEARRQIEAIVRPIHAFRCAIFGIKSIDLTGHHIVVDSYDSRSAAHSSKGDVDPATGEMQRDGKYVRDERTENGNIATNGKVIAASDAHIYGDASTNGGTAGQNGVLGADNVSGETRNDFYQKILPVNRPSVVGSPGTPTAISGSAIIGATEHSPVQVVVPSISLSGQATLRIRGARTANDEPQVDAHGNCVERFAQIVVDGDISLSGQAEIIVDEGVYVRIFVRGNADIDGDGMTNRNGPLHLQLYGIDPPPNADGTPSALKYMKIAGKDGFSGAVYAPLYDVEVKSGEDSHDVFGSFVGNTVRMTGVQSVHYDEALADGGLVSDYKIVSWFEEDR